jgi:hemerythrin-like metal-binding protein
MDWIEPEPMPTGPGIDTEHRIQLDLIDLLLASIREERSPEETGEVLDRLREFSRAHFLSEELLMRQHSYAGYEDHVADHTSMTDLAASMSEDLGAVRMDVLPTRGLALRQKFVQHILERDRALEEFLELQRVEQNQRA